MRKTILRLSLLTVSVSLMMAAKPSKVSKDVDARSVVGRFHTTGSFEIYAVPAKYNMIADDEVSFSGWVSHIPIKGQMVEVAHRGTDHNLTYEYDTHVPLVFWGPEHIKKGQSDRRVSIVDIAPTLAELLQITPPANATGKSLKELMAKAGSKPPKALVVFVLDQGGWTTLNSHKGYYPNLAQMMEEGFTFTEEYVDYGGSGTAASHAAIGTGTYPAQNGVFDNKPFLKAANKRVEIYSAPDGVDMSQLKQPSIADLYAQATDNKAFILSYGNASRAALGMAGHGSLYKGASKSSVFWFEPKTESFATDERWFTLPAAAKSFHFNNEKFLAERKEAWTNQLCLYRDNKPFAKCLMASPAFAALEGEVVRGVINEQSAAFKSGIPALIYVNLKGIDYCGHYLGQESQECHETFREADTQIKGIIDTLKTLTDGDMVAVFTADHGVAPLPDLSGGIQLREEYLTTMLNAKFGDPSHKRHPINAILNSVIDVDTSELIACHHTINELVDFLKSYEVNGKRFFQTVMPVQDLK